MNRQSRSNTALAALRKQVEKIVQGRRLEQSNLDEQDLSRLFNEVEAQQVDLERQNEELRHTAGKRINSTNESAEWYHSAPVALVMLDSERMIEQFNAGAADMLAGSKGSLMGLSLSSMVIPEDREIFYSSLQKATSNPTSTSCELRLMAAANQPINVQLHARFKDSDPAGTPRWLLALIDVSERKQAEVMLQDREARLSSILRAAPIGIGVVSQRIIQDVNDRFCEISGYGRDELIGQCARMIYPSDREYAHVGTEKYRQIEKHGSGTVETQFRRKDGTIIDVIVSSTPIDPNNLSSGVTFTALDITERKRTEEALRQSEALYRLLATNLPKGAAFVVDHQLRYVLAEGEALRNIGMSPADLEGKAIHEALDPELAAVYEPYYRSALKGSEFQWEHFSHGRYYITHGVPLRDPDGTIHAALAVSYDITERKEAEKFYRIYREQLEREIQSRTKEIQAQNKKLEALNAIIKKLSHNTIAAMENDRRALSKEIHDSIGGTLAAIKFQLEDRITKLAPQDDETPSDLMPLESIVVHLKKAIKETRRISKQLRSMTLDDFGLKPALIEHIGHFKSFYPGIEVVADIELSNEGISSEIQTVVYRVVQEALYNVSRHSAATEVSVNLSDHHGIIQLTIADNGNGFELDKALSKNDSLMGFGIHGMRERIEICKGEFQILSQPGSGTTIRASIPI